MLHMQQFSIHFWFGTQKRRGVGQVKNVEEAPARSATPHIPQERTLRRGPCLGKKATGVGCAPLRRISRLSVGGCSYER